MLLFKREASAEGKSSINETIDAPNICDDDDQG
jgi:hypothetical protein